MSAASSMAHMAWLTIKFIHCLWAALNFNTHSLAFGAKIMKSIDSILSDNLNERVYNADRLPVAQSEDM